MLFAIEFDGTEKDQVARILESLLSIGDQPTTTEQPAARQPRQEAQEPAQRDYSKATGKSWVTRKANALGASRLSAKDLQSAQCSAASRMGSNNGDETQRERELRYRRYLHEEVLKRKFATAFPKRSTESQEPVAPKAEVTTDRSGAMRKAWVTRRKNDTARSMLSSEARRSARCAASARVGQYKGEDSRRNRQRRYREYLNQEIAKRIKEEVV